MTTFVFPGSPSIIALTKRVKPTNVRGLDRLQTQMPFGKLISRYTLRLITRGLNCRVRETRNHTCPYLATGMLASRAASLGSDMIPFRTSQCFADVLACAV